MQLDYPLEDSVITFSYADHVAWRDAHPGVIYNPGVDFWSTKKTIKAPVAGTLNKKGSDSGYGNFGKLWIPEWEIYILLAHMEAVPDIAPGAAVQRGQQMGIMGWTGNVRPPGPGGAHVHMETRDKNQVPFDPTPYFVGSDQSASPAPAQPAAPAKLVTGSTGRVRIVCDDPANLRTSPGVSSASAIQRQAIYGEEFKVTGQTAERDGLKWREIELPIYLWVAEVDGFGNQMLEDV